MTPESELADYEGVTAVPGTATFLAEVLTPAVAGWFTGTAPAVATAGNTYVMRLADGSSYAKLRFTSIANSTANNAGQVTLEFAVQGSGATSFGGAQLLTVDLSTGAKSIDLNSGQVTTSDTDWDLRLEGYTIRVNGGASGSGAAGAFFSTTAFDDIAGATAPAIAYAADTFAGVFGPHKWYRYNILGDNRISPVFEVYLVRRGDTVWKLQVLNYYSATNAARHISFRYERISD
jgi:nucleoid-associated protein YgaU